MLAGIRKAYDPTRTRHTTGTKVLYCVHTVIVSDDGFTFLKFSIRDNRK